ncbi:MAG: proline racemase family protein [Bryobacteraceae bacterium]
MAPRRNTPMRRISFIDSHTGGEPTRTIVGGGPDLGAVSMADRLARFAVHHDDFRSAVVNEPRGSDVMVGALLCDPVDAGCAAGVIFFNNVGYLGMCGHGAIGVIATLRHQGRIGAGTHRVETPVGAITAILDEDGAVTIENVPSYRSATGVRVQVGGQSLTGDVAWGGNWFFLSEDHGKRIAPDNVEALTEFTWAVRGELARQGIRGDDGKEIDHIELFGPAASSGANSRNFVLCPGKAYDRSPCGTGTSAKVACLAAAGKLGEGELWRQESIVGSVFEASYRRVDGQVHPWIRGRAWVCAEGSLLFDSSDPFAAGIRK